MKILVCIKQVPGSNQVEVDPVTGVLKRSGIPNVSNVLSVDSFIKYTHELAAEFGVRIPSFATPATATSMYASAGTPWRMNPGSRSRLTASIRCTKRP